MKLTGAEMIVKALEAEGVEYVFGVPGGTVIPLYDALFDSSLRHVLSRHEQGACFQASGYARVSGKTGVCLATSGPGATNTVTSIADAYADSVPLVVLTGQVNTALQGKDAFQEADLYGATLSMVKHSYFVKDLDELCSAVKSAFHIASTGRPGPVLVDIPVNVQGLCGDFDYSCGVNLPGYKPVEQDGDEKLEKLVKMIDEAQRPVFIVGGGVIASCGAVDSLRNYAEKTGIPIANTLMGKGAMREDHISSLGMVGMHGTVAANRAVMEGDLLIAIGCRFSDRTTGKASAFAPFSRIVHIDIDPAEFGKNIKTDLAITSDAGRALSYLLKFSCSSGWGEWVEKIEDWKLTYVDNGGSFSAKAIIEAVRAHTDDDTVVVTEVGQNQMWAALHWKALTPRSFITSGGQGAMGFGLPAAIGAAFASKKPVVCLAGDGSFLMNSQELETAVRYGVSVKVVILNNGSLGMVRQWQDLFWSSRLSATAEAPVCDFSALAKAFGAGGYRADNMEELVSILDQAFSTSGPVVIDCHIPENDMVFPMVPAGQGLDKFLVRVSDVEK